MNMSNDDSNHSFLKVPLVLYDGPLPRTSLEASIAQHIDLILHSQKRSSEASRVTGEYYPGDFPFDPEFGFEIWDIKESADSAKKTQPARKLFETLCKKEKRLEIKRVTIYPLKPANERPDNEIFSLIGVRVLGKIKKTGKRFEYESGSKLMFRGCTLEEAIHYPEE